MTSISTRLAALSKFGDSGRLLLAVSFIHVFNDACVAVVYPLLPFIAADLNLSLAQVGVLKALLTVGQSVLQLPASLLASRVGEFATVLLGTAWFGIGLIAMAGAGGYLVLLLIGFLGNLGGNAQHPVGTAMVARAYSAGGRATAIGTWNFAGEIGKALGPAVAGLTVAALGWRGVLVAVGAGGLVATVVTVLLPAWSGRWQPAARLEKQVAAARPARARFYVKLLFVTSMLDAATRGAALTFFPFLLVGKGFDGASVGLITGLLFATGAIGKFVCGPIGDRWGAVSVIVMNEGLTAVSLLLFLVVPNSAIVPMAVVFGFTMAGTSSVNMALLAGLLPPERLNSVLGLYFTAVVMALGLSPTVFGMIGDAFGLAAVFIGMALLTTLILPLCLPLRKVI